MPKYRIELTAAAQKGLEGINNYTLTNYGEAQARKYLGAIFARMKQLEELPLIGRARDDIRAGYRSTRQGNHIILYYLDGETIYIAQIVHEKADIKRHL